MNLKKRGKWLVIFFILIFIVQVTAHSESNPRVDYIKDLSLNLIIISSITSIALVTFSIFNQKKVKKHKKLIFLAIIIPIIISSLFLAGSTIYANLISETKGPVHWHADFEIWNCNQKVDIVNPSGLLNKIGTSLFHEHNDNRMHVEGVVNKKSQADLDSFFNVIGGKITNSELSIPTNQGIINIKNNDLCNNKQGKLQVFLYKVVNPSSNKKSGFIYKQEKLTNFEEYILSPYSNIPPGDCIIIEFDKEKDRTDRICETYKIAIQKGNLKEYGS